MVLPRPSVLRGLAPARSLRSAPRTAGRTNWQHVARRGYASEGGHGHAAPSSDLPWLLSGIAVTIPSCYFLWPESHGDAHGAHGAHEEHEESEGHEESEEAPADDAAPADEDSPKEESADAAPAEEPKKDDSKDEKPQDDDSKDEEDKTYTNKPKEGESLSKATTEGKNMPDSKGKVEGVQFKGKTSAGDDDNEMTDVRKREPDSKGAFKKRIDSGYGKNLGEGSEAKDEEGTTPATSAKPPSNDPGGIDTKQKGLSTTPTRHSTQIDQDPEKSKKGEGVPETAKAMGTVDPNRPAV